MTTESQLLIALIRIAVTGNAVPLDLNVDWYAFLQLARMHKLSALAYDGLKKAGVDMELVPAEIAAALRKDCFWAISQNVQMEALRGKLEAGLQQRNVRHIFLKGAVLKFDYPVSALRTMSDMDILVHIEDYPAIDDLAKELEGTLLPGDGNHRSFLFPGNLTIEFHPNLLHQDTPVGTGINPGWQYAKPSESCSMALTEEGFYLHHICHMAEHLAGSGIGIRFVLDVWVHQNLRKEPADRAFIEQELARFGLLELAQNVEALARHWFDGAESTPLLEELGAYIISSGIYGTNKQAARSALSMSGGSRTAAFWQRAFYSRQEMEGRFPWLKGKPWLLPVGWCVRAFRVLTKRKRLLTDWLKDTGEVSKEEAVRQGELLARFGISRK